MSNIQLDAPLVNGDLFPVHEQGESCKLLMERLIGDDVPAPPRSLTMEIETESGKTVRVVIPNDSSAAIVFVDASKL